MAPPAAGDRNTPIVSLPLICHPFYGINMPGQDELRAATHSMEETREALEVGSLGFLSVDGLHS
jgi:glutamine phosphoribosylpyrophosphate amidotransferase